MMISSNLAEDLFHKWKGHEKLIYVIMNGLYSFQEFNDGGDMLADLSISEVSAT